MKWVRAKDGVFFGVCKGMARALDVPIGLFRLLWLASVLFFGVGLGFYLLMAICLPREDKAAQAMEPYILGVCAKISWRSNVEVGLVRFMAICLSLLSLGATVMGYIVMYFVFSQSNDSSSDNKPATPRATT